MSTNNVTHLTPSRMGRRAVRETPWGSWRLLEQGRGYRVKLLEIDPGRRLSLHRHHHRSERWVVISGRASVVLGHQSGELAALQSAVIPVGIPHRIGNAWSEPLVVLEIEQGKYLDENDIVCLDDDH